MAIQHRRGADVDFKAEKMLPGEIAVTIDGTRKVYAAFAPGDVKELASKEEVQKIVDNFENSVDEKINEAVRQVTDEATEQVEGIVAKGEEILNSIPADYQETVKEVTQLKEDLASTTQSKADAIICEAEGTTIVATDSSDAGLEGLSLYGKSKQGGTTGAQLLDLSTDGLTNCSYNNGVYTSSALGSYYIVKIPIETPVVLDANTDYYLKAKIRLVSGTGSINTMNMDDKGVGSEIIKHPTLSSNYSEYIVKYNNSEPLTFNSHCSIQTSKDAIDLVIEITDMILCKDVNAVYEPYTGNKPSPNPEYPQEVVSAGNGGSVEGKVCGKNLLKNTATTQTINGVAFTVNEDGSVTANGTATAAVSFAICKVTLSTGNYTGSGCPTGGNATSGYYMYFGLSNAFDTGNGYAFVLEEETTTDYVRVGVRSGVTVSNLTFKPMIRLTSIEDDTYEPYKEQTITLQTPNGLPGIPVSDASLATYTDENGQMWCADYADVERKVWVQRVGKHTDQNVNMDRIYEYADGIKWGYGSTVESALNGRMNDTFGFVLNDKFTLVPRTTENDTSTGTCVSVYGHTNETEFRYRLLKSEYPTKEDVAKAIEGATSYYPLATPIETPLSDEEILAYKALHTNKPTTTIMNSENVYMKAKYVADTKNHIKQNYVPLSEYTALEERVAAIEELVIS